MKKKTKEWLSIRFTLNLKLQDQTESKEFAKKASKYHRKKEGINMSLDKYKVMKMLNLIMQKNITNFLWLKSVLENVILAYPIHKPKIITFVLHKDSIQLFTKRAHNKIKFIDTDLKYSKSFKLFHII